MADLAAISIVTTAAEFGSPAVIGATVKLSTNAGAFGSPLNLSGETNGNGVCVLDPGQSWQYNWKADISAPGFVSQSISGVAGTWSNTITKNVSLVPLTSAGTPPTVAPTSYGGGLGQGLNTAASSASKALMPIVVLLVVLAIVYVAIKKGGAVKQVTSAISKVKRLIPLPI